jgi:hypothetical protein
MSWLSFRGLMDGIKYSQGHLTAEETCDNFGRLHRLYSNFPTGTHQHP